MREWTSTEMEANPVGGPPKGQHSVAGIDSGVDVAAMGEVERRLKLVLAPVEPAPAFREELRLRLARAARRERAPVQVASPAERTREVLVGAALLSVAGALVYLWRTRVLQATPRAAALLDKRPPTREMPFTAA